MLPHQAMFISIAMATVTVQDLVADRMDNDYYVAFIWVNSAPLLNNYEAVAAIVTFK